MVTLYHGAVYHLYRYKRYTDVRLVFAPEQSIAFFGGDPDNFEYPRYDLDFCLFRVYENGQPAKIKDYLHWSTTGIRDDELVFVAGHPGHTDRMDTVAHLEFIRDTELPKSLDRGCFARRCCCRPSASGARRTPAGREHELFGVQNSRKARGRQLSGLQDPAIMARKKAEEKSLRDAVASGRNPKSECRSRQPGTKWPTRSMFQKNIRNRARHARRRLGVRHAGCSASPARWSAWPSEDAKPNADRLPEFGESSRESLEQAAFIPPRRFTTIWKRSSWPTRFRCWSRKWGPTTNWS